eukprot:6248462-Prymnesium_polylepis.1
MALTPSPLNASRVRWSAACKAIVESHLESLKAKRRRVVGSRWSATPSVLLLSSRSAWYTPTRGDHEIRVGLAADVPNMGSSTPSRTAVTRDGATCGGRLLSAVEYVSGMPVACHRSDQLHKPSLLLHGVHIPTDTIC